MRKKAPEILLLVLLLGFTVPLWSQDALPKSSESNPALISWEATLAAGNVVKLVSRDGDMSRLTQEQGKKRLAITASLENKPEETVTFRIFEVKEVENAGEAFRQVEKVTLRPGASYSTAFQPPVTLRLKAVRPAPFDSADQVSSNLTSSGPITNTLISWEMTTPSQKQAHVVGRAGELTRVTGEGFSLGILPRPAGESAVDFRVFNITQVNGAGEALKEISHFTLTMGSEKLASQTPRIILRLTSVKP